MTRIGLKLGHRFPVMSLTLLTVILLLASTRPCASNPLSRALARTARVLNFFPIPVQDECLAEDARRNDKLTQYIYCHGTVAVLTVANVIMFIATGAIIWNHTRKTDILSSDSARARVQKRWFRVYSKLFFVSGMNWAAEHLSMIVDYDNNNVLFFCTDTLNALLGVVVFLILICHKRVLNSLHRWWTGDDRLTSKKRSAMASTLTRFKQSLIQSKFGSKLFSH